MRYTCDLSAEHCDLAWTVVNTSPGDTLELRAHESQRFIATLTAGAVRQHLDTVKKKVQVVLLLS